MCFLVLWKSNSDSQSCIVASSMRLASNWITGSLKAFDHSMFLRSCLHFSSFLFFQSLDLWMCSSSLGQNSTSGLCSWLCLVLCLSVCFGACLCLSSLHFFRLLNSFASLPGLPQWLSSFLNCRHGNSCNYLTRRV